MLDATELHDEDRASLVSSATGRPLTKRGEATRRRILEAAEQVFAEHGYHEASIVKVTERAGVALGTFYLYFDSKRTVFEALVIDLNSRVRQSMTESMAGAANRIDAERRGFEGFFRFTAQHPALYRVERQGWITAEWGRSENNLRAKFYKLTRAGRKQLEIEEENWERLARAVFKVMQST